MVRIVTLALVVLVTAGELIRVDLRTGTGLLHLTVNFAIAPDNP
jgi:hypothetical protein